jgi:hypothetical protein
MKKLAAITVASFLALAPMCAYAGTQGQGQSPAQAPTPPLQLAWSSGSSCDDGSGNSGLLGILNDVGNCDSVGIGIVL